MKQYWTDKEMRFLRDYYGFFATCHIAQILSRSEKSIQQKAGSMGLYNREVKVRDTLCWFCKKAGGLCSWSCDFTPVVNWKAIPTYIANDNQTSFIVTKCPEFEASEGLFR